MSTTAPTSGWSPTLFLAPGQAYNYTVSPGAGGTVLMQWSANNSDWFDFAGGAFRAADTGGIPQTAIALRGIGVGATGTFDAFPISSLNPGNTPVAYVDFVEGSSAAVATENFNRAQAALNGGGEVYFRGAGDKLINDTLTIFSNTTLTVGAGVTLKMRSGAGGKPVLKNYAYKNRASLSTAITVANAGVSTMTYTWPSTTPHKCAVGDFVYTQGATVSVYNTIARVLSVTDDYTLTAQLCYAPLGGPLTFTGALVAATSGTLTSNFTGSTGTYAIIFSDGSVRVATLTNNSTAVSWTGAVTATATAQYVTPASGTILAIKCDRNITLRCMGTIDYNYPGNTTGGSTLESIGVNLCIVQNLLVDGANIAACEKMGLQVSACRDVTTNRIHIPAGQGGDIVKTYGPAINCKFFNTTGHSADDGMSLQPYEAPAYPNFQWTRGDIMDVEIDGVDIKTNLATSTLVCLYPNDVDKMANIKIRRVTGEVATGAAIRVLAQMSATDTVEGLTIDGVTAFCRYGFQVNRTAANVAIIKSLKINWETFSPRPESVSSIPILFAAGGTMESGDIGFNIQDPTFGSGMYGIQFAHADAYRRCHVTYALAGNTTARGIQIQAAQTGHLIVTAAQRTGDQVVGGSTISGTITLQNCDTTVAQVISASGVSGTVNVNLNSNRFNNSSGGVVRATTGTWNVRSNEANEFAGTTVVALAPSGAPVFNLYGYDIRVDPIALSGIGSAVGQYVFSTQAGVEGGPSILTPAGWVALGTGASGVNTVIT